MAECYSQSCLKPNDAAVNEAEFDDTLFNVHRLHEWATFSTSSIQMMKKKKKEGVHLSILQSVFYSMCIFIATPSGRCFTERCRQQCCHIFLIKDEQNMDALCNITTISGKVCASKSSYYYDNESLL